MDGHGCRVFDRGIGFTSQLFVFPVTENGTLTSCALNFYSRRTKIISKEKKHDHLLCIGIS